MYGATLEPGLTEVELRYGRLTGGEASSTDGLLLETAHHFSSRFYGGVEAQWSRAPAGGRRLGGLALESIVTFGKIAGIDTAILGEVAVHPHGPETIETKLLFEKRVGEVDARLNLKAEKELAHGAPVQLGYAFSVDTKAVGDLRIGLVAIGEFGTFRQLTTKVDHFVGPVAKFEIERLLGDAALGIEAGYLFALGKARDESIGQLRLLVEYEFRF